MSISENGERGKIMSRRFILKVLSAVVVAVVALLVLSDAIFAQGRSDEAFERVAEVQQRYTDALMANPAVVGTAIGLGQGAQPVLLVLLEYGGVPGIPQDLEGVPVRPLVTGRIYALAPPAGKGKPPKDDPPLDPTSRWPRPVPIGVSTGHPDVTAGTIGCRVTDGANVYALSNNHVYANVNQAQTGDAVIQPGTFDGGSSPADDIGTLAEFEWIDFSVNANNVIDAAIATTTTDLLGNATPSDGYGTPRSTTAAAYLNQKVKKYGRTTGQTKGQVYALNAVVNVDYGVGVARFVDQIIITPGGFSAGGDSGSLIVVDDKRGKNEGPDDRKPVGLLFAGSNLVTIANPIDAVLSRFGVTVDGE